MASSIAAAIRPSIVMTLGFTLLCGVAYPFAVTGVGQAIFPAQANGSIVREGGKVVGSALIGQGFASPGYFHGRPSAAGKGYDASASSGSNLAPGSKDLRDRIASDLDTLHHDGIANVPDDMVTTSASGLDPDISPAAALAQAYRVAGERGLALAQVQSVIANTQAGALLGFIGEPRVNVLALNRQLDALSATKVR
jgi:potassium-transporting ATPase KdpC subunit